MAARLSHLAGSVFLVEECAGVLLWENEDNSQFLAQLPAALNQLVDSLGRIGLVHGDIRPWNIFYDNSTKGFAIIDWGFSFFLDEDLTRPPFWHLRDHLRARGHDINTPQAIDRIDASKTLEVVSGRLRYEDAWKHQSQEMQWRPPWAAR
jgi:aminoglycoside phosphotransferase (APT) family kinase protein